MSIHTGSFLAVFAAILFSTGCDGVPSELDPVNSHLSENNEIAAALPLEVPQWEPLTSYDAGEIVQFDGRFYRASDASGESNPLNNPEVWHSLSLNEIESLAGLAVEGEPSDSDTEASPSGFNETAGTQQKTPLYWRGVWTHGVAYDAGNVVYYDGQTYIAHQTTNGFEPPSSTLYWELLALIGETGPAGPKGVMGSAGPAGAKGDTGESGPAGPKGDTGTTGPKGDAGPAGRKGDTGDTGSTGPQGEAGPAGPKGDPGSVGMTWLGAWSATIAYNIDDAVSYSGSAYIAIDNTSAGKLPTDSDYWDMLAEGVAGSKGETGDAGPAGPKGDTGLTGSKGDTGDTGPSGPKGDTGDTGPTGPKGDTGDTGPTGDIGSAGIVWQGVWSGAVAYRVNDAVSYSGSAYIAIDDTPFGTLPTDVAFWDLLSEGVTGAKGDTGNTGPAGPKGDTGDIGPTGPKGDTGDTGPTGLKGDTGDAGPAGPKGDIGDTGPKGDIGSAGIVWQGVWSGAVAYRVNDAVSYSGSAYIAIDDTPVGTLPTDNAFWDLLAEGVTGAKGDTGNTGPAGPKGDNGDAGPTGPKGDNGDTGPAGPKGDTGDTGAAGPKGDPGDTGPAGPKGDSGSAGMIWQGAWSSFVDYDINDAISYSGSAYIAIDNVSAGTAPTDNAYWDLLAAAGTDGADGSSGGSGSGEPRYIMAGPTSSQFNGSAGNLAMNAACKADYGASARMATSLDIARYPLSTSTSGLHWVQGLAHPSNIAVDNTTGLDLSASSSSLNCSSWTSTSGNGLAIHGYNFSFNQYAACANALTVMCSVADGTAQTYEFSGFTTSTMSGNGGYLNMATACKSEFGSDARIASSVEVSQSNLGVAQSGVAWVQGVAHASSPSIDAISGANTGAAGSLSCKGWSDSGSILGLIVDGGTYSIGTQYCYQQAAVACSTPQ